jgi:uncharacterized protein
MEASAPAHPASVRYPKVGGRIHAIVVLAILGAWAYLGYILAGHSRTAVNPNRVLGYSLTLLLEWLVFAVVLAGVRRSGAPMRLVLGDRWQSARQVFRDIGIAAAFWIVTSGLLYLLNRVLRTSAESSNLKSILPHGTAEIALWLALSITAGICEETIFRGYLQCQFMALTNNAAGGILISAAAFGAAHAYQGPRMAILIALYGAMFGILAWRRGSVRPGMIAHAWQDSLGGIVGALTKH